MVGAPGSQAEKHQRGRVELDESCSGRGCRAFRPHTHTHTQIYIYIYSIPVVPHKAVAEVSRIGNYRRDWLL